MSEGTALQIALDRSAASEPARVAVEEAAGGEIGYRELARLSDRLRDRLAVMGVGPGDRVGFVLRKSIDSVAALFGILKCGAAYVPIDPGSPAHRNAYILHDCSVRAAVIEEAFAGALASELTKLGECPPFLVLGGAGGGAPLRERLDAEDARAAAPAIETFRSEPGDLAYILYTSGSTGRPKGVMVSHRAASSFVDWCCESFAPTREDRFSSHAPFHFDLSIHDIHVSLKTGATVVLIGEELGKEPAGLAELLGEKKISIWYSAPSILSLLAQYGRLERQDTSAVRLVLFAGEVFPVKHLRATKALFPESRFFNLYGPTETNVCTFYEIPGEIPEERSEPYPIGRTCSHFESRVLDEEGRAVEAGREGELCIAGPGVMSGYWNLPEQDALAFVERGDECWYRTGDLVIEGENRNYVFLGRRDRMVKRRAYRVELEEIEAGLYRHAEIAEAAVIALPDEESGVKIKAFLATRSGEKISLIKLKRFCSEILPSYMVPDLFGFLTAIPKTSTDKVDYQKLKELG